MTPAGDEEDITLTVDTGFTETLLLPWETVQRWQLSRIDQELVFLADGTLTRLPTYAVTILWDEEERTVEALAAQRSTGLIGIELLRGCTATFAFYEGGESLIERDL